MVITIICLLLILVMFFSFIIPRIGESFSLLFSNLDNYARRLAVYITSICTKFNIDYSVTVDEVQKWFASIDLSTILATAGNFLGNPHFKNNRICIKYWWFIHYCHHFILYGSLSSCK